MFIKDLKIYSLNEERPALESLFNYRLGKNYDRPPYVRAELLKKKKKNLCFTPKLPLPKTVITTLIHYRNLRISIKMFHHFWVLKIIYLFINLKKKLGVE